MPILAHDILGPAGGPTAFLLHGILGSRRNWASFARRLAKAHPRWRIVVIDLRNHGDSQGFDGPHTLKACAADIAELAAQIGQPTAIIGHSFGGKVALAFARETSAREAYARGHGPVPLVWALDSPPGKGDRGAAHEISAVIAAARSLPQPIESRSAVIAHFVAQGLSRGLGQWMTTNVTRVDLQNPSAGLHWRFDLDAIEAMLAEYWAEDLWPFLEAPGASAVHILRAGRSDRWTPQNIARLDALTVAQAHLLPNAGHWVHVDDAAGVLAALGVTLNATLNRLPG